MKTIPLSKGKEAIVDDDWYPILSRWAWYFDGSYAARDIGTREDRQKVYMHRYICMAPQCYEVDHWNQDKLDNRTENLRQVKPIKNYWNRGPQANNSTGFKGVSVDRTRGGYIASIGAGGKQYNLGRFPDPASAAMAYNDAAKLLHGADAWLNPI